MKPRMIQLTTCLATGDGIGGIIFGLHETAQSQGIDSHILSLTAAQAELKPFTDPTLTRARALLADEGRSAVKVIYHYGIQDTDLDRFFANTPRLDRVFYYHNFTPPRFFRGWDPHAFTQLSATAVTLPKLLAGQWLVTGDSFYNLSQLPEATELRRLLPVLPTPSNRPGDLIADRVPAKANTDIPSFLFVGRFSPNKRQDVLVLMVKALLDAGLPCRLTLAGKGEGLYLSYVKGLVKTLGLADRVQLVQNASPSMIRTLYRFHNYFACASEHEGFCVPILEAARQGCIPIARPFGAVAELLRGTTTLSRDDSFSGFCRTVAAVVQKSFRDPKAFGELQSETSERINANLSQYLKPDQFVRTLFSESA